MADMDKTVGAMISLMIMAVVAYLGPGIGQQIATVLPINESGDFASSKTGADIWNAGVGIVIGVVTIIFAAMAIKSLYGLRKE